MLTAVLAVVVCAFCAQAALAQAALPTAPAADRASQGGLTAAAASLPGENGSPLEPYLVTWLLPVSGILTALVLVSVDKNVRARYR
jgi:hypothetical protein